MVLTQRRFSEGLHTRIVVDRKLDILPPTTPEEILIRILAEIPVERQQWARKALVWILYTSRPLSVRELGAALMLQDESLSKGTGDIDVLVYRDITGELDEVFKGIFIVKQNEIHFGHPEAREFLLSSDSRQRRAWYDVKETAHPQITEACFFYLSLIQVQKSIVARYIDSQVDLLESPTYNPQYSLCSYAIR